MTNSALNTVLQTVDVRLEPLTERHREGVRAACPEDDAVWEIYPFNMSGAHFDPAFDRALANTAWVQFAALHHGAVVGFTSYLNIDTPNHTLEIGGTYFSPATRGTGFNAIAKRLMINHAFACGYTRIEFRVDARNGRSQAAVRKLGATYEGTLRKHRVTWTGHVRDTMIFGLLADEWPRR